VSGYVYRGTGEDTLTREPPVAAEGANERFYVNVQAELRARRWSVRELARRAGLAPNFLTRVRQGHRIALESAAAVAEVLGVPLGDLIAPGLEAIR
jgi:transcriptional regulator with XRE-family HTH domain